MTGPEIDWEVEAVLSWHDEDPKAAIAALLADIRWMRKRLLDGRKLTAGGPTTNPFSPGFGVVLASTASPQPHKES